jgi:hypothetical protein
MLQYANVCYSILWITGVWKWRIVGGGEDRRYINKVILYLLYSTLPFSRSPLGPYYAVPHLGIGVCVHSCF